METHKLGKGLGKLMNEVEAIHPEGLMYLSVADIHPNPEQPRVQFAEQALKKLADSIREHGLLQPIVVRDMGDAYQIIAGERRWRACKLAGLLQIPALVREAAGSRVLETALVENLLREDLDPMEKAAGFKELMEKAGLTQEEAAQKVGLERSSFANYMRLLDLPQGIQALVSRGTIAMGHARALLSLQDPQAMQSICNRIVHESLSVRQTERIVQEASGIQSMPSPVSPQAGGRRRKQSPQLQDLEERLMRKFETRVHIVEKRKGGKIMIEFYSSDDFERILQAMGL